MCQGHVLSLTKGQFGKVGKSLREPMIISKWKVIGDLLHEWTLSPGGPSYLASALIGLSAAPVFT